jgi:hypothetical protein
MGTALIFQNLYFCFFIMTATVPTLYSICFDYIKIHTEDIISLDGVPYKSTVENLVDYLFRSGTPLNMSILSVISESHSKALRVAKLPWTQLAYRTLNSSILPMLTAVASNFPKFITHLKLGTTDLCDEDIILFKDFSNLIVLDLNENQNITDRAISYLSTLVLNISYGNGLPYLDELYLDSVKGITDKSLKFIGKMHTLSYVSLTSTHVTSEVATTYLCSKGFQTVKTYRKPYFQDNAPDTNILINLKLYLFVQKISNGYPLPHGGRGRKPFRLIDKQIETYPPLDFTRNLTHAMLRTNRNHIPLKNKTSPQQHQNVKRQKILGATTNDFLAMFESEIADDG